ncbi:MAG: PleD family two-component response regulator [Oleiphilaceae bacterium]
MNLLNKHTKNGIQRITLAFFSLEMPTDSQYGLLFSERVRKSVEQLVVHIEKTRIAVTISGGIASH